MQGISILVPTRKHVVNLERLAKSINDTTDICKRVEIVFGVDEDDNESKAKVDELKCELQVDIVITKTIPWTDGGVNLSSLWNQCYKASKHSIVGSFGDDVIFQTKGWDSLVIDTFSQDKFILLCCNDLHLKGKLATEFFTHKQVHAAFGFYFYEKFRRWYPDALLDSIFRISDKLIYREDMVMGHYFCNTVDGADEVYQRMDQFKEADGILWNSVETEEKINQCIAILKELERLHLDRTTLF